MEDDKVYKYSPVGTILTALLCVGGAALCLNTAIGQLHASEGGVVPAVLLSVIAVAFGWGMFAALPALSMAIRVDGEEISCLRGNAVLWSERWESVCKLESVISYTPGAGTSFKLISSDGSTHLLSPAIVGFDQLVGEIRGKIELNEARAKKAKTPQ